MNQLLTIAFFVSTLAFALPILLAALGELIGEKSGVINIGLEGQMLAGALAGAAASFAFQNGAMGLLAAIAAGVLLAAVFAVLVISLRADAIVAGTGLNLLALGLTGVLHRALSSRAAGGAYESIVLPEWFFAIFAITLIPLLWWGLQKTRLGLQLRASGEYPSAAEAAGASVAKLRWAATLFNGALCGLAGAFLSMANTNSFAENMTAGRGFIALAIVIFGRWNPFGALAAALLFGAANAMQFQLQSQLGTEFYPLLLALPYVLTILTLAGFAGRTNAPAALGKV
jgi:simple sugar transport system permease protein